jgi:hypothetical protein
MLAANRLALSNFHVLVGPNASAKTTFLDAIQFIGDLLQVGAKAAVEQRTPNFFDLCFEPNRPISLAVEVETSFETKSLGNGSDANRLRYEVEIGIAADEGLRVLRVNLFILPALSEDFQPSLFGPGWLAEVVHDRTPRGWRKVIGKTPEGRDYFQDEKTQWNNVFRFGVDRPALGSLPEDPDRFPRSIAVRNLLRDGVRTLALDARRMREPAGPGGTTRPALDGSNLPYVARGLLKRDEVLFRQWVEHLSTAISGLQDVSIREREEDKHLVLQANFSGEHEQPIPSWLLSDGTLRLMALTLLSYAADPGLRETYLIEEPENGLHPLAIQATYEVLATPPSEMQLLCATHSPVFLAHTELDDVLVFRRAREGYAIVRHGVEVPELKEWSGRKNLSQLLVSGVLS